MRKLWVIELLSLVLIGSGVLAQKTGSVRNVGTGKAGLKGEYFNGPNFEQKVMTRTDEQVDFNWNWQSPGPGVQREYFSVRWTGKLYAPTSGKYRFSATVDDGVRVWVNGRKVIDEWRKQDDSQFVGEISLMGRQLYDLRIEYYNDWKGSVISVYWEMPEDRRLLGFGSKPHQVIPAKYLFSSPERVRPTRIAPAKAAPARMLPVTIRSTTTKPNPRQPVMPKLAVTSATDFAVDVVPTASTSKPAVPVTGLFERLKVGEPIVLRHVVFVQSTYTLLPESYAELDKLVKVLQDRPTLRVDIAGHTDNIGDKRLNQTLSEYRAKVVANYLIQHGIADTRITARGYGSDRPVADNANDLQRARNRRVEFVLND